MKFIHHMVTLVLGLGVLLVTPSVLAWGAQGHQVIAHIAWAQLTLAAKIEINRLLALEPGETLVSISTWADEHRSPVTAAWHYVNFPRDSCVFDRKRDCPEGKCVVGAIEKQTEILQSSADDGKRLQALKYLVHLVGDVYQPLHAGYQDDKGGNKYQLQAFGHGSNLHALWDTGLIKNLQEDTDSLSQRLMVKSQPSLTLNWSADQAAESSCRLVATAGFYPDRRVDQDYIQTFTPVLESQLTLAGTRLAALLNRILR